jgi:hypothetical protein
MSGARASPTVELQAVARKATTTAAARYNSMMATCVEGERGGEHGELWPAARRFKQGLRAVVERGSDRRRSDWRRSDRRCREAGEKRWWLGPTVGTKLLCPCVW